MTTEQLQEYKDKGWKFCVDEGYFSEREWAIKFKSPRLKEWRSINWSKYYNTLEELWARVTEKELLDIEANFYATEYMSNNKHKIDKTIKRAIIAGEGEVLIKL